MYNLVAVLLIVISFSACNRGAKNPGVVKVQTAKSGKVIGRRDTLKSSWLQLDITPKIAVENFTLYKYQHQTLVPGEGEQVIKLKVYLYLPPKKQSKINSSNLYSERSNYELLYTTDSSDSALHRQHFAMQAMKYYGDYFIVFFPGMDACDGCYPEEDAQGALLNQPTVIHIDTVNRKAIRFKYNSTMAGYYRLDDTNVKWIWTVPLSAMNRPFTFSIKRKEFIFGKRKKEEGEL